MRVKVTKLQRMILRSMMSEGAYIVGPYVRSHGRPWLHTADPTKSSIALRWSTVDSLLQKGLIKEQMDWSADVRFILA